MATDTREQSSAVVFEETPFVKPGQVKAFYKYLTLVVVLLVVPGLFIVSRLGLRYTQIIIFLAYYIAIITIQWYQAKQTRYLLRSDGIHFIGPGIVKEELVIPWDQIIWIGPMPTSRKERKELDKRFGTNPSRYRRFPVSLMGKNEWGIIYSREVLNHGALFTPSEEFVNKLQELIRAHGLVFDERPGNEKD